MTDFTEQAVAAPISGRLTVPAVTTRAAHAVLRQTEGRCFSAQNA